jgi:hypothetical protein
MKFEKLRKFTIKIKNVNVGVGPVLGREEIPTMIG